MINRNFGEFALVAHDVTGRLKDAARPCSATDRSQNRRGSRDVLARERRPPESSAWGPGSLPDPGPGVNLESCSSKVQPLFRVNSAEGGMKLRERAQPMDAFPAPFHQGAVAKLHDACMVR